MSYMFEILPSLLNGASMTLQVSGLDLSIPLGCCLCCAVGNPSIIWIDLYIWVMRGLPCSG